MKIKYDLDISMPTLKEFLTKKTNQIYKLLPMREEGADWKAPLTAIIQDLVGFHELWREREFTSFCILCKLESLLTLNGEQDFFIFRKSIFEILNLIGGLISCL